MNLSQKVVYNTAVQIIGRVIGLVIALITVSYVSNHLTYHGSALAGYGQYTIIFTYVSVIGSIADFGLFTLLVREITNKNAEDSGRLIGGAIVFRLLLMIATLLIFIFLVNILPYDQVVKQGLIIGVVIAYTMLFSQAVEAIFQAKLMSDRIVIVETAGKIVVAALTIYVLYRGYGIIPVVVVNLIGQVVTLLAGIVLALPLTTIKLNLSWKLWKDMSGQFWTIALINVLALIHFKSDTLLLTFFKPIQDVGIYGVAYKIFEVVLVLPAIFATNLLPVFSGLFTEGNNFYIGQVVKRSATILFIAAGYIALYVAAFAKWIVVFVTQSQFVQSAIPLRILSASILFVFLTTLISQAIIAARAQHKMVRGYLLVIVINVGLNLYAIPRYSYVGAATTTVITEAILLCYTAYIGHKSFGTGLHFGNLVRSLLAAFITYFSLVLIIQHLPGWGNAVGMHKMAILLLLVKAFFISIVLFIFYLWLFFGASVTRVKQLFQLTA